MYKLLPDPLSLPPRERIIKGKGVSHARLTNHYTGKGYGGFTSSLLDSSYEALKDFQKITKK